MENGGMTTDEFLRIAAVGAVMPLWGWISQKAYTHLRTKRAETGAALSSELPTAWAASGREVTRPLSRPCTGFE